jgi:60 kDa SS-A/Ro ribonucleoprotein
MVSTYLDAVTPRSATVKSDNDGDVYERDKWDIFSQWLYLGSSAGTYYAEPRDLTVERVAIIQSCLDEDYLLAIGLIVKVSESGNAPKNDPCELALAIACTHDSLKVRKAALDVVARVARYGTQLFHLLEYRKALLGGKWTMNVTTRRAIRAWYEAKHAGDSWIPLAYEVTKYQQRDGVSHADVITLGHVKVSGNDGQSVLRYVKKGIMPELDGVSDEMFNYLSAVETAKRDDQTPAFIAKLIDTYRLPWEVINTAYLNDPGVWEALLQHMNMGAMIRNLPKMTEIGLISNAANRTRTAAFSDGARVVLERLLDKDRLIKARVHPLKLLQAAKTYAQGHGDKSKKTWTPVNAIVAGLDSAFYLAYAAVEPTGKKTLLAVDCSSSVACLSGISSLSVREIEAAMALVTLNTEPNAEILGFTDKPYDLHIRPEWRIDQVASIMAKKPAGETFCSVPIRWARDQRKDFAAFVMYTDAQTSDGRSGTMSFNEHVRSYRQHGNRDTRVVVVAAASNSFSLNDPKDRLALDVAGFSAEVPAVISAFVGGKL